MTSATAETPHLPTPQAVLDAVAAEARFGLLARPRTLAPWLFYDDRGSELFEQITELSEYYPTRTERSIFTAHTGEILAVAAGRQTLTLLELGAGTATKTGILLRSAVARQGSVLYQPIDVSPSALEEAAANLQASIPGVAVQPQVANYTSGPLSFTRPPDARVLALYIGSSIGNFCPQEGIVLLRNLRAQLQRGDALLLGTDLAPGPHKSVATLVSAYDDAAGITAAFNRNLLLRLNRDLGTNFRPDCFAHRARWNESHSRIEMHLEALTPQQIHIPANAAGPALSLTLAQGETIHTENSYKFTSASIADLLDPAGFQITRTWQDPQALFAVTLASVS